MARRKRSPSLSESESTSSPSSDSEDRPCSPLRKTSKHSTKRKQWSSKSNNEKSKSKKKESRIDPCEEYLVAARCITRCIDMFCKIDKVISIGTLLRQCELADAGQLSEDEDDTTHRENQLSKLSQKTRDRFQRNYKHLLELAPGLKTLVSSKDPKKASELRKIIRKMESTILGTRSDDSTRLKIQISRYAALDPVQHPVSPPVDDSSGRRTHMGINHPVLSRFLCPISEIEKFNEDPKGTIKRLQSGGIKLTADAFPAFLWKGDPPGSDYNPDDMMDGFLEGFILERTMRHIFTGPSTALGSRSRRTRPCNAVLHDMTTVEAAHIAYSCVQVRFGLSAQNFWTEEDGDFKYRDFYRNIVEFIEDLPDDDRKKLFKKWNMKLFNNEDGRDVARDDAEDSALSSTREGGSDLARLRAQMASRNAAAKAGTADSDRPAPTVAHPPSAQVHPPPRTPLPSSPAHISSTPHLVPYGSQAPPLRTPLASTSVRNIPLPSQPASPPAKTVSRAPAKTMLDSQADGGTPGSNLTEFNEEEPQRKQKVPAKRKGKSKAVESSDDELELQSRSKRKAVESSDDELELQSHSKHKAAAPSRKRAARSTKKQKK
ncbi:hypothetical protein EDD22DRAFT_955587 [Suillus occidentalis]|nr:hypothetical protein EDD22DRAFT_955587 [Suillus occidentalis]